MTLDQQRSAWPPSRLHLPRRTKARRTLPPVLTANGFDVHVKLAGTVTPDPQIRPACVSFENLPQTPFEDFNLHFFGSERGLLATPTRCGTYPVESTFEPWDSLLPKQTSTQFFTLSSGPDGSACPVRTAAV